MNRYAPVAERWWNSKAMQDDTAYRMDWMQNDPMMRKVITEVEDLGNMLDEIEGDEIRERPMGRSRDMSRAQRDKLEWEGVHIENDDIKDVAEDVRDIFEDYMDAV